MGQKPPMVSIAAWNIRGVNTLVKQVEVQNLLRENRISILGLLETRVKEENSEKVAKKISDWNVSCNYPEAYNGRIWVFWNPRVVEMELLSKGEQFMHCLVKTLDSNKKFWCTFVYAQNSTSEREELWPSLEQLAGEIQGPWTMMGDFNTCLRFNERWKNGAIVHTDVSELENFTATCGLADLNYSGVFLSWCNKRDAEQRMYAKLDRILVNGEWLQDFNWSDAVFLQAGISDHSPGVLRICAGEQRAKSFKYCNFRGADPKFPGLVAEAWEEYVSGVPMFKVV